MTACVVHDCRDRVVRQFTALDVEWPCCAQHHDDVAHLLGITNPAKEIPMTATPFDPTNGHNLNLPFEVAPEPFQIDEPMMFSGGVVVMSLLLDTGQGKHPAVMFRFAKPDGTGFYPPMVLACDRIADLQGLPGLVTQAVEHAVTSAAQS